MKGRDWGMQVENESGGDMMISIVYYLIEKTGRKLQNCLVNSQEHESCRIKQHGMADCCRQICTKMANGGPLHFLIDFMAGRLQREHASVGGW